MNENKIREYRMKRKISMSQLSKITGLSKRIYMSFREWAKKKSFIRGNGKNSKSIRSRCFRIIFLEIDAKYLARKKNMCYNMKALRKKGD